MKSRRLGIALLGAVWFMANTARSQGLGTITGNILDASGAGVPNASVTVDEAGTGFARSVKSDPGGHYVIPILRPTQYSLTVDAPGFLKFSQSGINLLADQTATIDVHLQLGSAVQSVTVAGGVPLVDTATATITDVLGQTRIIELPLNGRDAAQLINLVAGASGATPTTITTQSSLPGSVAPTVNGSRTNQTTYMLDGANFLDQYYDTNIPFPFPDALQEFSVQTDDYSARYGGNAGGVVNVITKIGTNSIHGDAFEFVRNSGLNARNFFAQIVDPLHRNQFGGTLGGPVVIPHIYNGRNRTFFFFGYQGTRLTDVGTANNAFVPTAPELAGDFSALLTATNPNNTFGKVVQILDPLTGKPFPGNVIPTNRFDAASLGLEKFLPQAGGTGQVFFNKPTNQSTDEFIGRVDHELSARDRISGRVFTDRVYLQPQDHPLLAYSLGYDIPVKNFMVQETHIFQPNLLNQASVQYSSVPVSKIAASDSPGVQTFGVQGLWLPQQPWIQSITTSGFFNINGGAVGPFNTRDSGFSDNLSWVRGRHSLDFGVSWDRASVYLGDLYLAQGSFGFTSYPTNDALASFLLGSLTTFSQGAGQFKNDLDSYWGFYAVDSFHATRKLTLSFGLRYEPYVPASETKGRVEQFRMSNYYAGIVSKEFPNAPPGLLFPGDPGMPFAGTTGDYTDFAPRGGFAYDLTGDGRTSIRGGAGYFYDTRSGGEINNRFASITPFSPQVSLTDPQGPFSQPLLGVSGYPLPGTYPPASNTPFPGPVLVNTYDPSTKYLVPVTYQWNLVVERQLARDWMLQAAYVGSKSTHQTETIQLNPAVYIPGSTLGTDQRRLFQGYGSIAEIGQDCNSNFNALEMTLKKQMTRSLSLTAAYTFSRAIDDLPVAAGDGSAFGSAATPATPWYLPGGHQFDHGLSDLDHTHRLVVSYVWMLPALSKSNRFLRGALGDWQFSGIATLQTGDPLTVMAGTDRSQTGLNKDRGVEVQGISPSLSGPCANLAPCVNWLNPQAFALPAVGAFGQLGKGTFRGPGSFGWDMGLFRKISVSERFSLQFRAEFFNALNNVSLSDPSVSVSGAGFGRITAAADPRIGQLALKLLF